MSVPPAASARPPMPTGSPGNRSSDSGRIRAAAGAAARRFVLVFAGTLAASWALVLALGLLTDPLASFGTGLLPPLVPNDRDFKATAYQRLLPRTEALILGSSRVMKIRPYCLQQITRVPAFNFGLNSARAEDDLAALRFAESHGPVRWILIGLDPEALHNSVKPDARLLDSRLLRSYVDPSLRLSLPHQLFSGAVAALSSETVLASFRSIYYALGGRRLEPVYEFDSTGFLTHPLLERLVREGRFDQDTAVHQSIVEYRSRYAGFTRLSPVRVAALTRLLQSAWTGGARVDVFIPPLHPALVRGMEGTTLAARTRDTEALLSGFEQQGLLHFVRLPSLASFNGDPALFFDGAHMMEANTARVLSAVYGTGCAVH